MQRLAEVGELHEVAEILDGRVAAPLVEVVDERRPVGRREDDVRVPDLDIARGIASALGEHGGRAGPDDLAAHASREADARAGHVGAGASKDLEGLREVADLDADLLEQGVGVVLDQLEALGRDHLDGRHGPREVRQRLERSREPRGLSGRPALPERHRVDVE